MVLSVMLLYYMQNYFTSVDSELSVGKWLEDFSNLSLIIIISISYLYFARCACRVKSESDKTNLIFLCPARLILAYCKYSER